jgi:AbrB family looped-hinge helix DNA binding protein
MRVGPVLAIDKKNQANLIIFDWLYIHLWEISNFYNIMEEKDGKFIFGVLKVGDKGQIVIPRDARKQYNIKPGDALLLLGDKKGMALVKTEIFQSAIEQVMDDISK